MSTNKSKSRSCWLRDIDELYLELSEIILALADDLSTGCIISEYDPIDTPEKRQWYERYCKMRPAGIHSINLPKNNQ